MMRGYFGGKVKNLTSILISRPIMREKLKILQPTWMCGKVEMRFSSNRALAAKKCGSEHLAAIFCPSLLHLLPLSSSPQASLWHVPFL